MTSTPLYWAAVVTGLACFAAAFFTYLDTPVSRAYGREPSYTFSIVMLTLTVSLLVAASRIP